VIQGTPLNKDGPSTPMVNGLLFVLPELVNNPGPFDLRTALSLPKDLSRCSKDRLPFTVHYSLFTVYSSQFTIYHSLFTFYSSPFTVHYLPLTVHRSLFTVHFSLFTFHYLPLTVHPQLTGTGRTSTMLLSGFMKSQFLRFLSKPNL